jgi:CRISPR-associated protein Cmr2
MRHLFLFSIGPVQTFIAEARKTQDLYLGSRFLSYICKYAAETLKDEFNGEIIFPDINGKGSLPNRFIAEVDADNNDLKNIGQTIESKVSDKILNIANYIIEIHKLDKPQNYGNQIKNYFKTYWLFMPWPKGEKYADVYEKAEKEFAAIKNTRMFSQLPERGRKCSITGTENALFYRGDHKRAPQEMVNCKHLEIKYIAKGEYLGGVAFFKRSLDKWFKKENLDYIASFPSVSGIAVMNKVGFDKVDEIRQNYRDWDTQLLFDDNISQLYLDKQGIKTSINDIRKIKSDLKNNKILEKESDVSKYYAILVYDGDKMGDWLSGTNCKDDIDLKEFHKTFTTVMGEFAAYFKKYIDGKKGITVYAGGDDYLGFINLSYLFEVMNTLVTEFDKQVNNNPKIRLFIKEDETITISAGVAIAHYKSPLQEVLNKARLMEKKAKDNGRNSFAIATMKHSGELNDTHWKWGDKNNLNTTKIDSFIQLINTEKVSKTFLKNISEEFRIICKDDKIDNLKMVRTEIERLLNKSILFKNTSCKITDSEIEKLSEMMLHLFNNRSGSMNNYFSLLEIISFLSREVNYEN